MKTLVEEDEECEVLASSKSRTCWQTIKCIAERSWDDSNNSFPIYRRVLLLFSFSFYLIDVGTDGWVASEYYIADRRGTDEYAKSYLIATLVFIIVPCVILNFVSWALYTWGFLLYYHNGLKNFCIKRLKRLHYRSRDRSQRNVPRSQLYAEQIFAKRPKSNTLASSVPCKSVFIVDWPKISSDEDMPDSSPKIKEQPCTKEQFPSTRVVELKDVDEDEADFGLEFYPLDFFDVSEYAVVTLLHICLLGYLFRILRLIYVSSKKDCKDGYNFDRYRDLSFLRLVESFLEAAPQVILQLYLLVVHTEAVLWYRVVTPISIFISIVSLALSVGDYFSASQDTEHYDPPPPHQKKQKRLSWLAYICIIVWHFLMIVSRALSFALFATLFGGFVFLIIGVHYAAMVYWMFWQQAHVFKRDETDFSEEERTCQAGRKWFSWRLFTIPCKQLCNNYGIEFIVAAFNVFFHFKIRDGGSRYTLIPFYLLAFIENSIMIFLWYFVRDSSQCTWYAIPAIVTVFGTFFVGLTLMILYYQFCVPSQTLIQEGPVRHPVMTSSLSRMYVNTIIRGNFFKRLFRRNRTSN